MMGVIWAALAILVLFGGYRHRQRMNSRRGSGGAPAIDDQAIQRIIEEGQLPVSEEETLDLDSAAQAEDEFWNEYWDEPDEYQS